MVTGHSAAPAAVIVGGGPAGSAAALLLARRGLRVTLLDKARFPRDKLCGGFLSPEGVAALDRLGVLPAVLAAGAEPVTGTLVSAPSGRSVVAPFAGLPGAPARGLALRRRVLDALLANAARRAGADVVEGVHVEGPLIEIGRASDAILRRAAGVLLRRAPAGPVEPLPAGLVLAADGRNTRFARPPATPSVVSAPSAADCSRRTARTCAFQAHFHGVPPLAGRVEVHAFPGGYAGLVRVDGGLTNCCFLIEAAAARDVRGDADALVRSRLAANRLLLARLADAERCGDWIATGPLDYAVRTPAAPGILLLGDAAGIIDPFCGDGMAMALRSAEMAVESLLDSGVKLDGEKEEGKEGGTGLQRRYHARWSREFGRRLRVARWLRAALLTPWAAETLVAGLRPFPGAVRQMVRLTRT